MTETAVGQFDDRIDVDTAISSAEALTLVARSFTLLAEVKNLFAARFFLRFGALVPMLFMPWIGKILIDNVLLQQPFGQTAVRYPPFMDPIIEYFSGMDPMQIMLNLTAMFVFLLLVVGWRVGGEYHVEFFGGADAATEAENETSSGGSEVGGIWGLAEFWVSVRLTQRIANNLRTRLFYRLSRLPMTTLDDQRIGDSIYRVLYDTPVVPRICHLITIEPFFIVLAILINLYLIDYTYGEVSPEIVWVAWAMLPLAFLFTFPLSGIMRRVNQDKRAAGTATTNAMEEAISNIDAVQSLGGMEHEKDRFAERSNESFLRDRYALMVWIVLGVAYIIVTGIGALYVTFIVSDRIIEGDMTAGDFFVLVGIYESLALNTVMIGALWIRLQGHVAAVRRVFFFIDKESDEDQSGDAQLPPIKEGVVLENVSFQYPNGHQVLSDINLALPVGKLIAVVGPTGAGKTSLAYMIPAVLRPTSGKVIIDGHDLADVDLDSLRNQIAYVLQEHVLLSESIRENLAIANPNASEAALLTALQTAGCMSFIDKMPDGIDTVLGRSGNTLSVGQQQRLCIARGLVRDARILILDEPTAALDPQTENELVETLLKAREDRLVVVIAHRLSTIRRADQIVFLEEGQIQDVGNHEELMEDPDSAYREFVTLQSGA
jgi:ABC-type multidrug transport system fused ATPase/permease subunit